MISISKNRCVGCGICKTMCPEGVEISEGVAEIKNENQGCLKNAAIACPQKAIKEIEQDLLFAIGTNDDETIKSGGHVGMSKYFQLWEYSGGELTFKEKRENTKYRGKDEGVYGDPGKAKATSAVLTGIGVLVGKMFGPNIARLKNEFVCAVIREPGIKKATEIIKENINEIVEKYNKKERAGITLK